MKEYSKKDIRRQLGSKKGASGVVILIIVLVIVIAIASIFIKYNWRKFKAETSLGLTVAAIVLAVIIIIVLVIRHKIRKAKKQRERARLEKERLERERLERGEAPESTLGNGKFELSDITEAAGKVGDKISEVIKKDE